MRLLFEIDTKDYDPNGKAFVRPSVRGIIIRDGTSSMERKDFPSLPFIKSQAALSPRPETATKGGRILPSLIRNLVAWLS